MTDPNYLTEEEYMGGQFKCNCGNSFDTEVALVFHKNTTHLLSGVVMSPKEIWKRRNR